MNAEPLKIAQWSGCPDGKDNKGQNKKEYKI